jgi:putative heme-binding domain-containing protein
MKNVSWPCRCLKCWLLVGGMLVASTAAAAEAGPGDRIFSQQPEIMSAASATPSVAEPLAGDNSKPSAGPTPAWIWGKDQNRPYVVRKTFAGGSKDARLQAACDNVMTLYLNGQKLASSDSWQSPANIDVQRHIQPGENTLLAEISNVGSLAGFVLRLALTDADGKLRHVVTDDTWQVASSRTATDWSPVVVMAKYGSPPWGDVLAGASATAISVREQFNVLPGFQVERLFTVPKPTLGSWVCLAIDGKGRLIASDQDDKGLCRITPPAIGSQEPTKVERLDVKISSAQGMVWAFDSLYVSVNGPSSSLYRLKDTNNDDQFDEVVKLKDIGGNGEHGPHALRLSADGKSILALAGNHTQPPFAVKRNAPPQTMGGIRAGQLHAELPAGMSSRLAPNWDEDLVLPRQWDGNGHAAGILAPGGWIAKTDPDGKEWEIVSSGYRNQYDMALNADGELFAYDADMEWDYGMPWYRPTRVVHSSSGSEFGWRSGTGKWPPYYVDSLPPIVEIGPGSPVGVEFGYGTKFPAKYQTALFILDWTFGTMYAIHTEPAGASYSAVKEEFLSRTPLPLTDVVVGPDGALYFTVGGRGTQSELFRVTYVGADSTAAVDAHDPRGAELRALRHKLEAFHVAGADPAQAVPVLLPQLGHADRHIRYAARVGLERLPVESWQDAVIGASNPETVITGIVGLARQAEPALQDKLLAALDRLEFSQLGEAQQLELLRAYQLVLIRLGLPAEKPRAALGSKFEALFPNSSEMVNRELANLMVAVAAPNVAHMLVPHLTRERVMTQVDLGDVLARNAGYGGTVAAVMANQPDQQQMCYVFALRNLKTGWTIEERKTYFAWFEKARKWSGGASYQNFLLHIEQEAYDNATDSERLVIEASGLRKAYKAPALPKPVGPGKDYTLDELVALSATRMQGRDFKNGQRTFAAARCVICHRFAGDGGATGPDLTQAAGRFNFKDLAESILEPSKVVSDQYRTSIVETSDGKSYTGRVLSVTDDSLLLLLDPEDSTKTVKIPKADIEGQRLSAVSIMPQDLAKQLNENELLDLLAYLLSRGNPQDAMFNK